MEVGGVGGIGLCGFREDALARAAGIRWWERVVEGVCDGGGE